MKLAIQNPLGLLLERFMRWGSGEGGGGGGGGETVNKTRNKEHSGALEKK